MTRQPTPANILDNVLTADVAPDRIALRSRLRWDYAQVAPVDRKAVEDAAVDILANGQRATAGMMAIGSRLMEVKRVLPHGQFSDWCATEFDMSQRSAQIWMNAARTFEGKSAEISLLSDSSLALLAAPSTPEPARQQAIAEAQATGRSPSVQRTKEIIAEHKPAPRFTLSTDDLPDDLVAAGWTVRSKDIGSYWVVNETHGMETAIVRNWDGFAELCASLQKRLPSHAKTMASAISNQQSPISNPAPVVVDALPPADAPLPAWAQEEPAPRIRGYSVIDDYALRDMQPEPAANAYDALILPDSRIPAARNLITLYRAVIEAEDQYGSLTGLFSDYLAVQRDLTTMIGRLEHLIAAIEHPEEATPDN